jgi:hypothetical protein
VRAAALARSRPCAVSVQGDLYVGGAFDDLLWTKNHVVVEPGLRLTTPITTRFAALRRPPVSSNVESAAKPPKRHGIGAARADTAMSPRVRNPTVRRIFITKYVPLMPVRATLSIRVDHFLPQRRAPRKAARAAYRPCCFSDVKPTSTY